MNVFRYLRNYRANWSCEINHLLPIALVDLSLCWTTLGRALRWRWLAKSRSKLTFCASCVRHSKYFGTRFEEHLGPDFGEQFLCSNLIDSNLCFLLVTIGGFAWDPAKQDSLWKFLSTISTFSRPVKWFHKKLNQRMIVLIFLKSIFACHRCLWNRISLRTPWVAIPTAEKSFKKDISRLRINFPWSNW